MDALAIRETKDTISYLNVRPSKSMITIDIFNLKNGSEMEALQIRDRTTIIMEATKVVTKKKHAQIVHKKDLQ